MHSDRVLCRTSRLDEVPCVLDTSGQANESVRAGSTSVGREGRAWCIGVPRNFSHPQSFTRRRTSPSHVSSGSWKFHPQSPRPVALCSDSGRRCGRTGPGITRARLRLDEEIRCAPHHSVQEGLHIDYATVASTQQGFGCRAAWLLAAWLVVSSFGCFFFVFPFCHVMIERQPMLRSVADEQPHHCMMLPESRYSGIEWRQELHR